MIQWRYKNVMLLSCINALSVQMLLQAFLIFIHCWSTLVIATRDVSWKCSKEGLRANEDFLALGDREELERHHAVAKMKAKINEIKKRAEEAQSLQWHVTTERSELTRPKRTDYFIDKEHTKLVSSSLPAPLSTFSTSLSEQLSLSINGQTPWHRNAWISKWYPSSNKEPVIKTTKRYCDKLFAEGTKRDGIYGVFANGKPIEVFCEFKKGSHNWLVFQRREDGSIDFFKNWTEYDTGFGSKTGEFWLGLSNLFELTRVGNYILRVDLEDFNGKTAYAEYNTFAVGSPSYNYRLIVSGYHGNAGDSLSYHNGLPFTTKDRDNDNHYRDRNCAEDDHGAWWYNSCQHSNLNGEYLLGGVNNIRGVGWYHWKHNHYSMKKASMKLRPV